MKAAIPLLVAAVAVTCVPVVTCADIATPEAHSICEDSSYAGTDAYARYCSTPAHSVDTNNDRSGIDNTADDVAARAEAQRQELQRAAEAEQRRAEAQRQAQQAAQRRFETMRDAATAEFKDTTTSAATTPALKGGVSSGTSALKGTSTGQADALRGGGTDASVVDARRVPSGLPAGLDRAIDAAYSHAPDGVAERVRKGFQAVKVHDWKVARAWFADALQHDPGNADLQQLVKLAGQDQKRLGNAVVQPSDADLELLFPTAPVTRPVTPSTGRLKTTHSPAPNN